jgi:hypothetical protein
MGVRAMKTTKRLGWGSGVGGVLALALGGLAACGSDFASDCRETRTCPATGDNLGGDSAGGAPDGKAGSQSGVSAGEAGTDVVAVVAITPSDEATGIEPDTKVVIELSEPLDEATVNANNLQILDGGVPVSGKLSYEDTTITFVPDKPLALLAGYEVQLSTAVTDVEGAGLEEAFGSSFAVRDGAWSVTTVVQGSVALAPTNLGLTSDGQALVTWVGTGNGTCPATARWYRGGAPLGTAKTFAFASAQYCADIHSAVSPNGVGVVSWFEEAESGGQGVATAEFRAGLWGNVTQRSQRWDNHNGAAAAADDGAVYYIAANTDVMVWQTSVAGAWSKTGKLLSERTPTSTPQLAIAKNGDALAVWRDTDTSAHARIMVASYSKQSGSWSNAVPLPGSVGSASYDRGIPAAAFDDASQPLVVWQRAGDLVSSRFDSLQQAWAGAVTIAKRAFDGNSEFDPAGLVFDGKAFVVAYESTVSKVTTIFASRYDADENTWGQANVLADGTAKAVKRMPSLSADAHGNLLVVWPSLVSAGVYGLGYQRFDAAADSWLGVKPIAGVTINDKLFVDSSRRWAFGGSDRGQAALTFSDIDASSGGPKNLQLASFY